MNPTYTSVQVPRPKTLPSDGYALCEQELAKRELDDDILSKENEILTKRMQIEEEKIKTNSPIAQKKLNNEAKNDKDENSNYMDSNNNISSLIRRKKTDLNVDDVELPPSSLCGLATTSVTYTLDE